MEAMIGRSGVFGYDETKNVTISFFPLSRSHLVYFGYEMQMRQFQSIKLRQHHFVLILIDRSSLEQLLK